MNKNIFRFPQFIRFATIIFAFLALIWAIHFIIFEFGQAQKWFQKATPFVILLLVINVLRRNLLTPNSIHFYNDYLEFKFLLKGAIKINWNDVNKLEFGSKRLKMIVLTYNKNGKDKLIFIPRGIREIITALNRIAEHSPNLQLDDFMKTVIKNET
ncbi:MAG: hypothetical protein ISS28_02305 [Candidatus Cloacimonetes bacterium]|nr:hypothetical protein [Candidatus Cloacimonadota bacterium]MBL7085921.1 hypothetical protein [Candidatus Cloacimonadota bacterium]